MVELRPRSWVDRDDEVALCGPRSMSPTMICWPNNVKASFSSSSAPSSSSCSCATSFSAVTQVKHDGSSLSKNLQEPRRGAIPVVLGRSSSSCCRSRMICNYINSTEGQDKSNSLMSSLSQQSSACGNCYMRKKKNYSMTTLRGNGYTTRHTRLSCCTSRPQERPVLVYSCSRRIKLLSMEKYKNTSATPPRFPFCAEDPLRDITASVTRKTTKPRAAGTSSTGEVAEQQLKKDLFICRTRRRKKGTSSDVEQHQLSCATLTSFQGRPSVGKQSSSSTTATPKPASGTSGCTFTGALLVLLVLSNTFLSKLCFAVVVGKEEEDFDTDRHIDVGGSDNNARKEEKIENHEEDHGAAPSTTSSNGAPVQPVVTSSTRAQPPNSSDRRSRSSSLVQKTSVERNKRFIRNPFEHIHVPEVLSHWDPQLPFEPTDQTEEGKEMAENHFLGAMDPGWQKEDPLDPDGLHSAWDTFYDSFLSAQQEEEGVEGVKWDADGDYPISIFDTNGDGAVSKADFDAVDTNHDGRVDEDEFLHQQRIMENRFEAVQRFSSFDEDKQERILSRDAQDDQHFITGILDTNHDKTFDARDQVPTDPDERNEFLKEIERLAQHHQNREDAIDAIEALDKDHNDKVDKDELRKAALMPSQLKALGLTDSDDMMAKLDTNNDGEFDKTDVVAMKNEKILDALNHEQSMDDIHKALAQGPSTSPLTDQLDMDGNGKVDDNELALADKDHDHMLDTKELEKASRVQDNLDTNNDGIVNEKDSDHIAEHVSAQDLRAADARTVSYEKFRNFGWLRPEVGSDLWRVLDTDNDDDIQEDEFKKFAGKDGIMDMHDWKVVQEQAEKIHKHDVDQYNVDMRNHAIQTALGSGALYLGSKLHQKRKAGQAQERVRAKEKQDAHQREEEDKARLRNSAAGKREALVAAQNGKKVGEENRLEQEKLQKLKEEGAQREQERQEAEAEWKRQQEQEEAERAEAERAAQKEADAILQQIQTAVDENASGRADAAAAGVGQRTVPAAEVDELQEYQQAHPQKIFGLPAAAQLHPRPGADPLNDATNASPSHSDPTQHHGVSSQAATAADEKTMQIPAPGGEGSYPLRAAIAQAALAEQGRARDAIAQQAAERHVTPFERAHTVDPAQTTPLLGHHDDSQAEEREDFPQTPPLADTELLPEGAVPKDQRFGGGDEKVISGAQERQEAAQQEAQSTQQQQQLQALHEQYPGYSTTYLKKMLRQQKLQHPLRQGEKLQAAQQLQQLQQARATTAAADAEENKSELLALGDEDPSSLLRGSATSFSSYVTPPEGAKQFLGLSATSNHEQQRESGLQQSSLVDDPFVMQMNHADKEKMQQLQLERQQLMQEKLKQHILLQQQQRQQREQDAAEQNGVAEEQSQLRARQLAKEKAQQKALETARQAHWENLQAARDHERQPTAAPDENPNPALEIGVGKPITNPTIPETAKEKWLSDLLQDRTAEVDPTVHLNATGNGAVLAGVGGPKQSPSSSFLATSSSSRPSDVDHVATNTGRVRDETRQAGAPDEDGFVFIAPVVNRKEAADIDPELEDNDLDVALSFLQGGAAAGAAQQKQVVQQQEMEQEQQNYNMRPAENKLLAPRSGSGHSVPGPPARGGTTGGTTTATASETSSAAPGGKNNFYLNGAASVEKTTFSSRGHSSQGAGRGKGRRGVDNPNRKNKDYSKKSRREEEHANKNQEESKPLVDWYKDGTTNLIWFKDWTIAPFQKSASINTHLIETWWAGSAERKTWTKFEYDTVTHALFEKETEPAVFGAQAKTTTGGEAPNHQQSTTRKYNLRGTSKLKAKVAAADGGTTGSAEQTAMPLEEDAGTATPERHHDEVPGPATTAAGTKPAMAQTTHMNLRGSTKKMLEEQKSRELRERKNIENGQAQEHVLTDEAAMTISPKEEDTGEQTDGAQFGLPDVEHVEQDHDYHYEKTYVQPLIEQHPLFTNKGEHDEHENISLYEKYGTEELLTMVIYCTILFLLAYFCLQKREQTRLQELLQMKNHPGRYADVGLGKGGRGSGERFLADQTQGRGRSRNNDHKLPAQRTTRTNSARFTCGSIMETSLNFLCGTTQARSRGEDEDPRRLRRHESRGRNHSSVVRKTPRETSPSAQNNYMQYVRSRTSPASTTGTGGPVSKMTGKSKMWLQFEEDHKLEYIDPNLSNTNQRDQYGVCHQETNFAHHADGYAAGINEITTTTTGTTNKKVLQEHQ